MDIILQRSTLYNISSLAISGETSLSRRKDIHVAKDINAINIKIHSPPWPRPFNPGCSSFGHPHQSYDSLSWSQILCWSHRFKIRYERRTPAEYLEPEASKWTRQGCPIFRWFLSFSIDNGIAVGTNDVNSRWKRIVVYKIMIFFTTYFTL